MSCQLYAFIRAVSPSAGSAATTPFIVSPREEVDLSSFSSCAARKNGHDVMAVEVEVKVGQCGEHHTREIIHLPTARAEDEENARYRRQRRGSQR